jgi:hypothetical protein
MVMEAGKKETNIVVLLSSDGGEKIKKYVERTTKRYRFLFIMNTCLFRTVKLINRSYSVSKYDLSFNN